MHEYPDGSMTWERRILTARDDLPVAEGSFVHVFVDRQTRRPWQVGAELRATLQTLLR